MKLTITTHDCLTSNGFYSTIEKAFSYTNHWATEVEAKNGRITAKKDNYPIRFAINGFTPRDYHDLMYGDKRVCVCKLVALAIPVSSPNFNL